MTDSTDARQMAQAQSAQRHEIPNESPCEKGFSPVRTGFVERALSILAAERERCGKAIDSTSIERISDALKLSPAEMLQLTKQVARAGLAEADIEDADDTSIVDATDEGDRCVTQIIDRMMRHTLLTPDEERELGRSIRLAKVYQDGLADGSIAEEIYVAQTLTRGKLARQVLILSNIRLAMDIARRYEGRGLDLDDLLQEGIVGLMRAVESFDASLGFRFSTYATWWIRQSITRAVFNNGRTVRLPVHVAERLTRLRRTAGRLRARSGTEFVKPQAIADELGWPLERVGRLLVLDAQRFVGLETNEGDEASILDRLPSPSPTPEKCMEDLDFNRYLNRCLDGFDKRAGDILRLRFGLTGEDARTLEEVGVRYGLTRERIRQIQSRTLQKMGARHQDDLKPLIQESA